VMSSSPAVACCVSNQARKSAAVLKNVGFTIS
jgi:hypothetical protein